MATEEGVFSRLANDILQATEQLEQRLEDGLSVLLGEVDGLTKDDAAAASATADPESMGYASPTNRGAVDSEFLDFDDPDFEWSEEVLDSTSPLSGMADNVMGDILQGQAGPRNMMEHLEAFRHAIAWSEPFIVGILAFHFAMFLLTLFVTRRSVTVVPRIVVLLFMAGLVRFAETINKWGANHWQDFATQNYFDPRGVFVSIFLCAPLLLISFIMLVLFLREASQLLVQVKTAELKQKRKKAQQAAANAANSSTHKSEADGKKSRRAKKDQ